MDRNSILFKIDEIARFLCRNTTPGQDRSLGYGSMGIVVFLMEWYNRVKKEEYYDKASELIEDAFDFLSSGVHTHSIRPDSVDLAFDTGLCGISWGIGYLCNKGLIECELDEVMSSVDSHIFRRMIDDVHSEEPDLLVNAFETACYALLRPTRIAKEYGRRFLKESFPVVERLGNQTNKPKYLTDMIENTWLSMIAEYPDLADVRFICAKELCGEVSDPLRFIFLSDDRYLSVNPLDSHFLSTKQEVSSWFTSSKGLFCLHKGLRDGLAGLGLRLLDTLRSSTSCNSKTTNNTQV